jgi:putative aminopeptidase FrvX
MSTDHPVFELMQELLSVPSPGGREARLAAVVRKHIERSGYPLETDAAGNVLVRLKGEEDPQLPLMVLAAHLDEVALVVTAVHADGSLSVDRSGWLHPYKLGECALDVIGDEQIITGIASLGAAHAAGAERRQVSWSDYRIITGLSPRRLEELEIRVGSTAVPVRQSRGPYLLGDPSDPLIAAWTFDDRGGVLTLIHLLEEIKRGVVQPRHPTLIAFTTQEEKGCYGAKVLAHRERPQVFVAIDGCPIAPGSSVTPDERPCVWSMDMKAHYDHRLVHDFHVAAREARVGIQTAVLPSPFPMRRACSTAARCRASPSSAMCARTATASKWRS